MAVTLRAPAKVNLRLRVGPPDGSGFHPLSTLFCALELADIVVLEPRRPEEPALAVDWAAPLRSAPDLGDPAENLAVRAARRFFERAGLDAAPSRVRLTKRIPPGGGLGGGSSDAAAVLRGLRRLYPGALDEEALMSIAAGLGSDVPFFLLDTPLAHGGGRGERLTPLAPLPARPVVVVLPGFPVATADAYRWLDEDRAGDPAAGREGASPIEGDAPTEASVPAGWEEVVRIAGNDLEAPVFRRHPGLRALLGALEASGAAPARMAGSGSSLFGVYETEQAAERAAAAIRSTGDAAAFTTRTLSERGPG